MSSRNVIITSILTSVLTTICVYFGLDKLKSYKSGGSKRKVDVPLVLGLSHAQADNVLRQAGLKLQVLEHKPHPKFQKGTICTQVPPKGTRLPAGSVVTVVISEGQPMATIPQVTGMHVKQARAALKREKFVVTRVTTEAHPTVAKDHVTAITPLPGTKQKRGSKVSLKVSSGPEQAEVPKVKGKYYRSAKKAIIEAGFVVGKVKWRENDDYDDYIVLSQNPKAGTKAPKGSKIDITVNRD